MSDVVRKVTVKLIIDNKKLVAPEVDTTSVKKAMEEVQEQAQAAVDSQATAVAKSPAVIGANYGQAAESAKRVGEGAFVAARGIALMTSANEEDLAALTKRIAKYQGMFDIFKGSTDTILGVVNLTRALTTTQAVATAGTVAQTAATTGLATAQTAAATTGAAMWAAITGPIGLGVAAVTGVVALATAGWYAYSYSVKSSEDALNKKIKQLDEIEKAERKVLAIQQESQALALRQQSMSMQRDFDFGNRNLTMFGKSSLLEESAMKRRQEEIVGLLSMAGSGKDAFLGQSAGLNFREDQTAEGFRNITENAEMYLQVLENIANAEETRRQIAKIGNKDASIFEMADADAAKQELDRIAQTEQGILNQRVEKTKLVKGIIDSELDIQKQRIGLLDQERSRLEAIATSERQRLSAITDQIKAEESRGLSNVEKFGRMNPFEQQQIIGLGEKVKAGGVESLTKFERDKLDQSGFAQGALQRFFINQGQQALGGNDLFGNLGTNKVTAIEAASGQGIEGQDKIERLAIQREEAARNAKEADERLEKTLKQIGDGRQRLNELLKDAMDYSLLISTIEQALAKRDQQVDQLKTRIDKAGKENAETSNQVQRRLASTRPGSFG